MQEKITKTKIGTATIIHLPGSLWRVFYADGTHQDWHTQADAEAAAREAECPPVT